MLKRYDAPPDAPPPRAMVRRDLWNERRVPLDLARLCLALAAPSRPPIGNGLPVVLVPGWRFGEASVEPLRRYLARRGFRAQHWGNGVNRGKVERDTRRLLDTTRAVAAGAGQPVNLVGWSLGGVVAREVARIAPEAVRAVFTYGTPVIGGPKYTLAADAWGSEVADKIERRARERDAENPIQVPIHAVFTRRDAVVHWAACIDRTSPRATHYEARSTHFSMGFDPAVWRLAAEVLADPIRG